MILRYFRRRRAARKLAEARERHARIKAMIVANRKAHKAWVPLLGNLVDASNDMLRAENELRGA